MYQREQDVEYNKIVFVEEEGEIELEDLSSKDKYVSPEKVAEAWGHLKRKNYDALYGDLSEEVKAAMLQGSLTKMMHASEWRPRDLCERDFLLAHGKEICKNIKEIMQNKYNNLRLELEGGTSFAGWKREAIIMIERANITLHKIFDAAWLYKDFGGVDKLLKYLRNSRVVGLLICKAADRELINLQDMKGVSWEDIKDILDTNIDKQEVDLYLKYSWYRTAYRRSGLLCEKCRNERAWKEKQIFNAVQKHVKEKYKKLEEDNSEFNNRYNTEYRKERYNGSKSREIGGQFLKRAKVTARREFVALINSKRF